MGGRAPSPAAFALAVSAHSARVRAILLIGTASTSLKGEPFAALYASPQILLPINRQEEFGPKCVIQAGWTNAKLRRGARWVFFQKQIDFGETAGRFPPGSSLYSAYYFAEITCFLRHLPKFNVSAHAPNIYRPRVNEAATNVHSNTWSVWKQ
jgi:hypothetical protein